MPVNSTFNSKAEALMAEKNDTIPPMPTADDILEAYNVLKALQDRFARHGQNTQQGVASKSVHQAGHLLMRAVESLSFDEYRKLKGVAWE